MSRLRSLGILSAALAGLAFTIGSAPTALGQVSLLTPASGSYSQDFNTLPTTGGSTVWSDNTTIANWYANRAVSPPVTAIVIDTGTSTTGGIHSYGSASATDRALGSLGSSTPGTLAYGAYFQNNTTQSITSLALTYTGEQWRDGGNLAGQTNTLQFFYKIGGAAPTALDLITNPGDWTAFTGLDFVSPIHVAAATPSALDGNAAANRQTFTSVGITGLPTINDGQKFWIAWQDVNDAGNDHGLGVDDLTLAYTAAAIGPRNLTWDSNTVTAGIQEGAGTWSTGGNNWKDGLLVQQSWSSTNPDQATFGSGAGAGGPFTVTVSGGVTAQKITFAANSASYVLTGSTITIPGSSGVGIQANQSATVNSNVTLSAAQQWNVVPAATLTVGGVIANGGNALTVDGGGTLVSNGVNTGGGATNIVNGSTLKGSGTFAGPVNINSGSTIAPGSSPGQITLGAGGDVSSNGNYAWELGAYSTATPGTNFDQIKVTGGTFTMGGTSGFGIGFTGSAQSPNAGNAFFNSARQWTVVDAAGGATADIPDVDTGFRYRNGVFTFSKATPTGGLLLNWTPKSVAAVRNLTWDGAATGSPSDTDGIWNAVTSNWRNGVSAASYNPASPDNVTFGKGAGAGTPVNVGVGGPLTVGKVTFANNSSEYDLNHGQVRIAGSAGVGIDAKNTAANSVINSSVAVLSAQSWNTDAGANLNVNGSVSGASQITKTGSGILRFGVRTGDNGSRNTFTGGLKISDGEVKFGASAYAQSTALRSNRIEFGATGLLTADADNDPGFSFLTGALRTGELHSLTAGAGTITASDALGNGENVVLNTLGSGTYSGTLTNTGTANGRLTVQGIGSQTFTGTVNLNDALQVGSGATATLAGSTTLTGTGIRTFLNAGKLVFDNTTTNNNNRYYDGDSITDFGAFSNGGGGEIQLKGNSAGTTESVGSLQLNSGNVTVRVTNAGTGADLTFLSLQQNNGQAGVNFVGEGGTLGSAGGPRVFLTYEDDLAPPVFAPPKTNGIAGLTNGVIARTKGSTALGFAVVNGSDYATYDTTNGVTAFSGYVALGTAVAADNAIVTGNDSVAAAQSVNTLKILPSGAGQSLDLAADLTTVGFLLTGSNDYTITSSGGSLKGNSTRNFHIWDAARTLTISAPDTSTNPINKLGDGTLVFNGGAGQFTGADKNINLLGGILRTDLTTLPNNENAIRFRGGVLEIDGGGSLSRNLGTSLAPGALSWFSSATDNGSGGFSAKNGTLAVSVGTNADWNSGPFVSTGYQLMFGSASADSRVNFTTNVGLGSSNVYEMREIRVADNAGSSTDIAEISGVVSNGGTNTGNADLLKTGAGTLQLSGTNTYTGGTIIAEGTLLASNSSSLGKSAYVLVGNRAGSASASLLTSAGGITIDRDLTVQSGNSGTSTIGGTHTTLTSTYSGDITVQKDVTLTSATGGTVVFTGDLDNRSGSTLTKTGGGIVDLSVDATHGVGSKLAVQQGTALVHLSQLANPLGVNLEASVSASAKLELAANATRNAVVNKLTIAGGASPTGKVDIQNNSMLIDYSGASPFATIQAQVISGYAFGGWNGNGINSTAASADPGQFGVGYAENSDLGLLTYSDPQSGSDAVDGDTIILKYTYVGDTDLDGDVDGDDYLNMLANIGTNSGANWYMGDNDYNGTVDGDDYLNLLANIGNSGLGGIGGLGGGGLTPVPEPSTLVLAGLGAAAIGFIASRRRRK